MTVRVSRWGRLLVLLGKNASWLWLLNHTVFYWSPCEHARRRRLQTQQRAGERCADDHCGQREFEAQGVFAS
ncbi:MAG: hypothetical protein OXN87_14915, partial [Chloroflexota bacterium]|nr:hypothetical protein [Chloroflexota bacterium]